LIEEMFGIEVRRLTIPSYHDDVEVYELRDGDGRILGTWHLDPFRRAGKHRGAWTQTALSRRALNDGRMQTPLVFVGLDLVDGLISFTESRAFLHELGHALEHCLSPAPKHTPDTNEISSMYLESFVTQPELLRLFPVDAASLRRQRIQQRTLDLARICLWSKIDLDLHRTRHRCAADLKQTVREAVRTLELSHPLVTPETLTLFDHAFADEEYASTYYSYLLSFVYAQALRNSHGTNSFREFWNGSAVDFTRQTPLSAIDLTGLVEERC
jgi:peptidyl-dipeptidase Dcp